MTPFTNPGEQCETAILKHRSPGSEDSFVSRTREVVKTLISKIHDKKILSMYPVSGGDINSAFQLTLVDGTQLFMKRNRLPSLRRMKRR